MEGKQNNHMPFCGEGDLKTHVQQKLKRFLEDENDKKNFDNTIGFNKKPLFTAIELLTDEEESRKNETVSTLSMQNKWGIKMDNPFSPEFMNTLKYMTKEMESISIHLEHFEQMLNEKETNLNKVSSLRGQIPDSDAFRANTLINNIIWDGNLVSRIDQMCKLMLFMEYCKPVLSQFEKIIIIRNKITNNNNKDNSNNIKKAPLNFQPPRSTGFPQFGNIDFFNLKNNSANAAKTGNIIVNDDDLSDEGEEEVQTVPKLNFNLFKAFR